MILIPAKDPTFTRENKLKQILKNSLAVLNEERVVTRVALAGNDKNDEHNRLQYDTIILVQE